MSESIEILSNEDLYSMIAKGIVEHAKTSDELTAVKAELAELRKERDELREAILKLGYLTGSEGYCGDRVVLSVRLAPREADTWNALVAKVSAVKGETKATKETEP